MQRLPQRMLSSNPTQSLPTGLLLILLIATLAAGCRNSSKSSSGIVPESAKEISTALQKIDLEVCTECKNNVDVHKYEDSLQSTRLDIPLLDLAKVFLGRNTNIDWESSYYRSEMPFILELNSTFHEYETYARQSKADSLPRLVVLYTFDTPLPNEEPFFPLPLEEITGKFYFEDTILNRYFPKDKSSNWVPDTNYVWNLFDTLVRRGLSCYPLREGSLGSKGKNGYFYKKRVLVGEEYRFSAHQNLFGYVEEAPYENHYSYQFLNCQRDEETGKYPPGPCLTMGFFLGWASSHEHYQLKDSTEKGLRFSYQIEPEDFAIYFTVYEFEVWGEDK
jgi:hypothetical protein